MFLYYLIIFTTFICTLYYFFVKPLNYWKDRNVKGPKPLPLFGNFKDVAIRKKHMGMIYNEIYKQFPEEKVVGMYRMTVPTLLIRDLDIVKQILTKDFDAFSDRNTYFSKEGLGDNIFHSDVTTWKILRNRLTSVFTSSKYRNTFQLLSDRGDKFVDYIADVTLKEPEQDIFKLVLKYTVSTVMVAIFGLNIDTFNSDCQLFETIDSEFEHTRRAEMDLLFPGFLTKFNLSILSEKTIDFSHSIVEKGINFANLKLNKNATKNAIDVLMNLKKEGDIYMSRETSNGSEQSVLNVTDYFLAAQAWIMYVAGNTNNRLTLTYALYHLARNPETQDKLISEIDKIIEQYNGKLTYEALKDMKYLDMVFKETLRMHPLTNGLLRRVLRDVKLDGTNITVSEGATIMISPYSIQHDEKNYPEPERFNPDRFSPQALNQQHPCAFLPFGFGRRSCIGSQFARIQFGICLSKFLLKFRVETTENTIDEIKYYPSRLLLTPDRTILLNIVPRRRIS